MKVQLFGGTYYKFPLRVSEEITRFGDERAFDPPQTATMAVLVFEPHSHGWCCMACAEARGVNRAWTGLTEDEIDAHCEAHQMGFDYALVYLKKAGRLDSQARLREALEKCWPYLNGGSATEFWSQCKVCKAIAVEVGPNASNLVHTPECWYGKALAEARR